MAGLQKGHMLTSRGKGGYCFTHGETGALPGTRVAGLLASVCSDYNLMLASLLADATVGFTIDGALDPKSQALSYQVQVKLFAFLAFGRLDTK